MSESSDNEDKPKPPQPPPPQPTSSPLTAESLLTDAILDGESLSTAKPSDRPMGLWMMFGLVGAAALGTIVFLSYWNSGRYFLDCGETERRASKGIPFVWGRSTLSGPRWAAIPLSSDSSCGDKEFATEADMAKYFTREVISYLSGQLTEQGPTNLEQVEKRLQQAMLLTREPSSSDQRRMVERLEGDIAFFRGKAALADALSDLENAEKQFLKSVERNPRHQHFPAKWVKHTKDALELVRRKAGENQRPNPRRPLPPQRLPAASRFPSKRHRYRPRQSLSKRRNQ